MMDQHFEHLLGLIALERDAEREENKRELARYPLAVRAALGKTVTGLAVTDEDVGVGGYPLLVLSKGSAPDGGAKETGGGGPSGLTPFHGMNQGDNVLLSFPPASGIPPMDGTLYDVSDFEVTVALNKALPTVLPTGGCQLDLLGSDATYKRMRQALNIAKRAGKPDLERLRAVLVEERPAEAESAGSEDPDGLLLANPALNAYQVLAVKSALSARDVALIHGPPGTGKTTVLTEIIVQSVRRGMQVLASAPSNIAVDNMVEKLLPHGLRLVRLGHPARTLDDLRHVTLRAQEANHPFRDEMRRIDDERHRLMGRLRRRAGRARGLTPADVRAMEAEIRRLTKEVRDISFAISRELIHGAHVVLSTHGGVSGLLARIKFPLVVMDEASQATEPLSWVRMILGKKVVFAGDSCQLPPTIYSENAAQRGLSVTVFDRMKACLPERFQTLLRVQYRMNEDIMQFPSTHFYNGQLIADETVRAHRASGLEGVAASPLTTAPLLFIDTAGTGYEEGWNALLESRENEGEAGLVLHILSDLRNAGVPPDQMALLTPYVAQVKMLKRRVAEKGMEIGSVDSFQGREKEVVILSLVRSNPAGEVGFLSDIRRMNVAMTRARRLLIVIGDSATIGRHPFYRRFLDHVEAIGAHRSAWEWR